MSDETKLTLYCDICDEALPLCNECGAVKPCRKLAGGFHYPVPERTESPWRIPTDSVTGPVQIE